MLGFVAISGDWAKAPSKPEATKESKTEKPKKKDNGVEPVHSQNNKIKWNEVRRRICSKKFWRSETKRCGRSENYGFGSRKDEAYKNLLINAKREAVKKLFKEELDTFIYSNIGKEELIDALTNFIQFDDKITNESEGPLRPCIVLKNTHIDEIEKSRFNPVRINKICNFDINVMDEQVYKLKKADRRQFESQ